MRDKFVRKRSPRDSWRRTRCLPEAMASGSVSESTGACVGTDKLSDYASKLSGPAKSRYLEKIRAVDHYDPYLGVPRGAQAVLPPVDACDLVSYLVLETSFVTAQQFKARKGMEAYNQFVSGWIKEVKSFSLSGKHVTLGRVKHSQRFSETPLHCWIITLADGAVCCAHCTCMAGLGETCTHIAAVLFYLEASSRAEERKTCTEGTCQWKPPTFQKTMEYASVRDIDFTSAKRKKSLLDPSGLSTHTPSTTEVREHAKPRPPTQDEKLSFFGKLSESGAKPAILSLVSPYAEAYVPKAQKLPTPLPDLFKPDMLTASWDCLVQECEKVQLVVTDQEAKEVEAATREQAQCKLWFVQRAGRVTASNMYDVCKASTQQPSASLIKRICYPDAFSFTSLATEWGRTHEKAARALYCNVAGKEHEKFSLANSGLVISRTYPYIGASPDGLVSCSCCGHGVVEIKCPFSHRGQSVVSAATDDKFCLHVDDQGKLELKRGHRYYYQVQAQMFICDVEYCDFVVCTFSGDAGDGIFVERVLRDDSLWQASLNRVHEFFKKCVLPELLGKWWTSSSARLSQQSQSSVSPVVAEDASSSSSVVVEVSVPTTVSSGSSACTMPVTAVSTHSVHAIPAAVASASSVCSMPSAVVCPTSSSSQTSGSSISVVCEPLYTNVSRKCMFCPNTNPSLLVRICRSCGVGYHHMCQSLDEDGRLCNACAQVHRPGP